MITAISAFLILKLLGANWLYAFLILYTLLFGCRVAARLNRWDVPAGGLLTPSYYVSGVGLMIMYYQNPELTQAVLVNGLVVAAMTLVCDIMAPAERIERVVDIGNRRIWETNWGRTLDFDAATDFVLQRHNIFNVKRLKRVLKLEED